MNQSFIDVSAVIADHRRRKALNKVFKWATQNSPAELAGVVFAGVALVTIAKKVNKDRN